MNSNFLDGLVKLLERSSLSEIEYSDGEQRIKFVKDSSYVPPTVARKERRQVEIHTASESLSTNASPKNHVVTAGLVGVLYRSPAPNQPAFVSIGDIVKEGQTLAIVEAMKLLNSIEADCGGRVTGILVEEGATVSPDTALFTIEPIEVRDV